MVFVTLAGMKISSVALRDGEEAFSVIQVHFTHDSDASSFIFYGSNRCCYEE